MNEIIEKIATFGLPLILAMVCHEYGHGWMARRCGDDTAEREGRLTLNPLAHIDPVGTILVPLILLMSPGNFMFGWAKPVPVRFGQLNNPIKDMVKVAAAGPAVNLGLAIISGVFLKLLMLAGMSPFEMDGSLTLAGAAQKIFIGSMIINVVLMVFNLIPIPPLDGGRIAVGLLRHDMAVKLAKLEPYGMFIIIGLLMIPGFFGSIMRPVITLFIAVFY